MKAVGIIDVGRVGIVDIPAPEISEYECLVKMYACGFCNCTDVESVFNTHLHKDMPFPHIQGHEGVGEIVRCGSRVRNFEAGDRIVFPEGRIAPESGFKMCGCGHFAEYCIVRDWAEMKKDNVPCDSLFADWPRKFPKEIAWTDAAVITPIRETLSAVRNFGIGEGGRVLIYGDGPSALGLALFSKMEGASCVWVAGHHKERLSRIERASKCDAVINSEAADAQAMIAAQPWDIAIDAVGSPALVASLSHIIRPGGKVGLYAGLHKDNKMIDMHAFANNVSLHKLYSPYGDLAVHGEAMRLIVSGQVHPRDFYSHVLHYTEFERAMKMVLSREAFKAVLTF